MDLEQIITRIQKLKQELDSLKHLKPEYQQKLDRKLRLDWNYNSNHIEGNTLTYGETELLLFFDKMPEQSGSKDFREFEEMKEHDVAIKLIEELTKDKERSLTEGFICDLNKIILVRNFWKDAVTPDGQPTRKEIKVGDYKKTPNSVITATGELFNYPSPQETPALMVDLLQWYKEQVTNNTHPLLIAALLHYKFVCIHPFDDGNGRISRLLMNYVLLKYDYPPAIIKSEDKKAYLTALNRADTGDTEAFVTYIGEQLVRSLELSIKAAQGESIEEQGDLDKEIELLKKRLKGNDEENIKKSNKVLMKLTQMVLIPFVGGVDLSLNTFDDFFLQKECKGSIILKTGLKNWSWTNNSELLLGFNNTFQSFDKSIPIEGIRIGYYWKWFKMKSHTPTGLNCEIVINTSEYSYNISYSPTNKIMLTKSYSELITLEEQTNFIETIKRSLLAQIKSLSEQ